MIGQSRPREHAQAEGSPRLALLSRNFKGRTQQKARTPHLGRPSQHTSRMRASQARTPGTKATSSNPTRGVAHTTARHICRPQCLAIVFEPRHS